MDKIDARLLGCLAQAFDEKVGADMSGYDAARSLIESLDADGYAIVGKPIGAKLFESNIR